MCQDNNTGIRQLSNMSHIQSQEDIYLESYPFTTAASIIGLVDRKVSAVVVGGSVIIGVLRTFDQFGNLVIHNAIERVYFAKSKEYSETENSTTYIIRGENLLMLGDIDIDTEDDEMKGWTKLPDFEAACKIRDEMTNKLRDNLIEEAEILKQKYPVVSGDFIMRLNSAF